MEEKQTQTKTKSVSVGLPTFLLFLAIIGIGVMGYFLFKVNDDKSKIAKELEESKKNQTQQQAKIEEKSDEESIFKEYQSNFSRGVKSVLGSSNEISINLNKSKIGITRVYVNSRGEAYVDIDQESELFTQYGESKKVATRIVNAFVCPIDKGDIFDILFLTQDGTISKLSGSELSKGNIEIQNVKEVENIINVISYSQVDDSRSYKYTYAFIDIEGNVIKADLEDEDLRKNKENISSEDNENNSDEDKDDNSEENKINNNKTNRLNDENTNTLRVNQDDSETKKENTQSNSNSINSININTLRNTVEE